MKSQPLAILGVVLAALLVGCVHSSRTPSPGPRTEADASSNRTLLQRLNTAHAWLRAKKTKPIWVKRLEHEQTVKTLEGPVPAHAGDYLCRGEIGEVWPQKGKDLEARYTPTEAVDADGWRRYEPRPDSEGVLAAQVAYPFEVQAKWGKLTGKAGDYVLKNFRDRAVAYPEDVWIVDQRLFQATYEILDVGDPVVPPAAPLKNP